MNDPVYALNGVGTEWVVVHASRRAERTVELLRCSGFSRRLDAQREAWGGLPLCVAGHHGLASTRQRWHSRQQSASRLCLVLPELYRCVLAAANVRRMWRCEINQPRVALNAYPTYSSDIGALD